MSDSHSATASSESHGHQESHGHGHEEHHGGVGTYLKVFAGLIVLTLLSFWVGNSNLMVTTPKIGWALMMAISCAKAMLVISFFMHLLWEANWKYVLTIPASIMSVFLVLMLVPDVGQRMLNYSEERNRFTAIPSEAHGPAHAGEATEGIDHGEGSHGAAAGEASEQEHAGEGGADAGDDADEQEEEDH